MILRAVGDYKDTFDATTGKITRRVGVLTLRKNLSWYTNGRTGYFYLDMSTAPYQDSLRTYNTHFPVTLVNSTAATGNVKMAMFTSGNGTELILIHWDEKTTLAAWQNWLEEQYAAGTPVTVYYPLATPVVEDWTETSYCETPIKIATNLYNSAKFQNVIDALDTAVSTINNIVAGTIAQANSIGELASGKQTRPNPNDSSDTTCPTSCPNYRQCLLVEKDDGTPCWYEILDPFYNLFTPVIANDTNAASTTTQNASGLPAGYTELSYVNMPAGSYLGVTGQSITSGYKIEFNFATTDLSNSLANYFGARASGVAAGGGFRVTKLSNQGVAMYGFDTTDAYESGANILTADTRYKYVYENGTCTLSSGGTDVLTHTYTVNDTSTITAFGINAYTANGTTYSASGLGIYFYGLKIWNAQGELVADYVPAKNSAGVVGMYDTVSDTFFTNTGTGTFTAGPVVSSSLETVWTATFAANANNNIPAGTVYGTAICNATSGTTNTAATAAQMSANNWTASGNYCWCRVTSVNTGGTSGAPSSEIWVYDGTSATCNSDCVGTCATSVGTGANKNFRKAISGLN